MRRRVFLAMGVMALGATRPLKAQAHFPQRPVRIVVPYSPGIGHDLVARALAERLARQWNQPVVVENRPGAAGAIGFAEVKRVSADPHTLFVGDAGTLAINPRLYARLPYSGSDFAPLATLYRVQFVLFTGGNREFATLRELIERAKRERVTYASLGRGHPGQLASEMLARAAGVRFTEVPFRDVGQFMASVVTGEVNFMLLGYNTARGFVTSGKLQPLAVGGAQRLAELPQVPTMAEAGIGGVERVMTQWTALVAPSGAPRDQLERIETDVTQALGSPEMRERIVSLGLMPYVSTSAETAALIAADRTEYAALLDALRISAE